MQFIAQKRCIITTALNRLIKASPRSAKQTIYPRSSAESITIPAIATTDKWRMIDKKDRKHTSFWSVVGVADRWRRFNLKKKKQISRRVRILFAFFLPPKLPHKPPNKQKPEKSRNIAQLIPFAKPHICYIYDSFKICQLILIHSRQIDGQSLVLTYWEACGAGVPAAALTARNPTASMGAWCSTYPLCTCTERAQSCTGQHTTRGTGARSGYKQKG